MDNKVDKRLDILLNSLDDLDQKGKPPKMYCYVAALFYHKILDTWVYYIITCPPLPTYTFYILSNSRNVP